MLVGAWMGLSDHGEVGYMKSLKDIMTEEH